MTASTNMEKDIVLTLFKDFSADYNSSTLSKKIGKTRVGVFKALNTLEKDTILKGKTLGKARFYKVDLADEYARKNVETLLMEEAKKFVKWKDEFKELFNYVEVAVLFGSTVKNEKKAKDIDLLLVLKKENNKFINNIIKEKNNILLKQIHPIKQTFVDFLTNIQKKDEILLNAMKTGIVLYGYEKYIELIKNVSSKK